MVRSQPRQIVLETLSQKNSSQKKEKTGGVVQGVGPEFKLRYCKKKKKVLQRSKAQKASRKMRT
jgi:hypothetical protein